MKRVAVAVLWWVGLLLTAAPGRGHDLTLDGSWLYRVDEVRPPHDLSGEGWSAIDVPCNWYEAGVDVAGVVWFAREVTLPDPGELYAIEFEGVDYAAEVYWDGRRVGAHRGYFAPFRVALPESKQEKHVLAVRVDSPRETPAAWSLRKTLIKGVLSHHDTRPGNAWSARGQDGNTGGIWGHVTLRSAHASFIDLPMVTTTLLSEETATLSIRVGSTPSVRRARFKVLGPDGQLKAAGELRPHADQTLTGECRVTKPALWWPRDLGEPNLHTLEVYVDAGRGRLDVRRVRFGIRSVERDGAARLLINHQPVFLRGTNYIGTLYFAHFPESTLLRDFALMEAAHINAVRVHAHVTLPRFYEVADERGMLVFQDFPLQWGYDDSEAFAREAARQAREMVETLYNHASVVFWASMNEAPFSSEWMKYKYPDYDPEQNRRLDRAVFAALQQADSSRPAQPNAHPSQHAWAGWYEGHYRGFSRPTPHALITEFGAQAVPSMATLETFIPRDRMWPIEPNLTTWEYRGFQLRELREIAKVPLGGSPEELIRNTQHYQAKLIQFAVENLRRQKWQPLAGIFQFMLVEHWPSISWGVVDYRRTPKLGYAALARAYQPMLPAAVLLGSEPSLRLYVINDLARAYTGCTLSVRTSSERSPPMVLPIDIAENQVIALRDRAALPGADETLILELFDAGGTLLSRNAYEPGYFKP